VLGVELVLDRLDDGGESAGILASRTPAPADPAIAAATPLPAAAVRIRISAPASCVGGNETRTSVPRIRGRVKELGADPVTVGQQLLRDGRGEAAVIGVVEATGAGTVDWRRGGAAVKRVQPHRSCLEVFPVTVDHHDQPERLIR